MHHINDLFNLEAFLIRYTGCNKYMSMPTTAMESQLQGVPMTPSGPEAMLTALLYTIICKEQQDAPAAAQNHTSAQSIHWVAPKSTLMPLDA
jgi:hypothetical protein